MNGHPTNEDREALIAGDRAGSLDHEELADVALLARLLGDPSTWAEPPAGLEGDVMLAVERADALARRRIIGGDRCQSRGEDSAPAHHVVGRVRGRGNRDSSREASSRPSRRRVPTSPPSSARPAAAPAASASAKITHNGAGFRIVLDARGLPALPAGEYYQAWLKNSAGIGVPIGTFSSSDGRVTLWSGVSPQDFPVISVTVEKADGNQTPSGNRVLAGEVHAR